MENSRSPKTDGLRPITPGRVYPEGEAYSVEEAERMAAAYRRQGEIARLWREALEAQHPDPCYGSRIPSVPSVPYRLPVAAKLGLVASCVSLIVLPPLGWLVLLGTLLYLAGTLECDESHTNADESLIRSLPHE